MKRGALALAAAWFLAACAAGDAYLISAQALAAAADPRVVILPFENQTADLAAPGMLRELAA